MIWKGSGRTEERSHLISFLNRLSEYRCNKSLAEKKSFLPGQAHFIEKIYNSYLKSLITPITFPRIETSVTMIGSIKSFSG